MKRACKRRVRGLLLGFLSLGLEVPLKILSCGYES